MTNQSINNMRRREFLKVLGASIVVAGVGVRCTPEGTEEGVAATATVTQADASPITLDVIFPVNSDAERETYLRLIEQFQRDHSSIRINAQATTWPQSFEIVQTRMVAGDLPAVMMHTPERLAFFGDGLADLSHLMSEGLEQEFSPDGWHGVQIDGKFTGLPNHTSVRAIAYNVDYFEQVGLEAARTEEEAWTWEELVEAAELLQEETDAKFGLQFEKRSFDGIMPLIYQNGGSLMDIDQTRPTIQEESGVETIRWIADLHQRGLAPQGILDGTEEGLNLFASGISAMWLSTSNTNIPGLVSQMTNFDWDFMVMTKHPHIVSVGAPAQWSAFETDNKDAAWEYIKFITSPESMTEICSAGGLLPVRPAIGDQVEWPERQDLLPFFLAMGELGFNAQLQAEKNTPVYGAIKDQMTVEVANAAAGQQSPEAAAQAIAELLSNEIEGNNS
jgi:ABC-type glycerol-3-phosphate transport system substrate-binding protein